MNQTRGFTIWSELRLLFYLKRDVPNELIVQIFTFVGMRGFESFQVQLFSGDEYKGNPPYWRPFCFDGYPSMAVGLIESKQGNTHRTRIPVNIPMNAVDCCGAKCNVLMFSYDGYHDSDHDSGDEREPRIGRYHCTGCFSSKPLNCLYIPMDCCEYYYHTEYGCMTRNVNLYDGGLYHCVSCGTDDGWLSSDCVMNIAPDACEKLFRLYVLKLKL